MVRVGRSWYPNLSISRDGVKLLNNLDMAIATDKKFANFNELRTRVHIQAAPLLAALNKANAEVILKHLKKVSEGRPMHRINIDTC